MNNNRWTPEQVAYALANFHLCDADLSSGLSEFGPHRTVQAVANFRLRKRHLRRAPTRPAHSYPKPKAKRARPPSDWPQVPKDPKDGDALLLRRIAEHQVGRR